MTISAENLPVSATIGLRPPGQMLQSAIGMPLSEIGSGRPLTVSAELAAQEPSKAEEAVEVSLRRISGRRPVFRVRTLIPENGPCYTLVNAVEWDCPPDRTDEAASLVARLFQAAPEEKIVEALFKLRMLTRGRAQADEGTQEAEALIWVEQLRCWPGDIVLTVLRSWPAKHQFWPTWAEIQAELELHRDRRMALANHIRTLARRKPAPALTLHPESPEQREAAVAKWEETKREMAAREAGPVKPVESPDAALARLAAECGVSPEAVNAIPTRNKAGVSLGEAVAKAQGH